MRLLKKRRIFALLPIALLGGLLLAACNFPGAQPTDGEDALATQAAQTVAAELTETGDTEPTGTDPAQGTITATAISATDTPFPTSPTPEPTTCTDAADFVTDVSIPDNTRLEPGEDFTKTWRLENAGNCDWSTNYELVFDSGARMGASRTVPLPGRVEPGQSIDLSIAMTAPASEGTYQGFWQLRNEDDVIFGIGDDAETAFWVKIRVDEGEPEQVYDFDENFCDAEWRSGAGELPCPGDPTDNEGFVIRLTEPTFETGRKENEAALETHPEWTNDGVISGEYPFFEVEEGDVFRTVIGCRQGGGACQVTYQLNYTPEGGSLQNLAEWAEEYDDAINEVEVDLSSLAGQRVQFALVVLADGQASQDWALWLSPRIMR